MLYNLQRIYLNLHLGKESQKASCLEISMIEQLHVFVIHVDSSWCLFLVKLAKFLLLSCERATLLLSIRKSTVY